MVKAGYILLLFSVASQPVFSQTQNASFGDIRKSYEKKDIDDHTALPDVKWYIRKAKSAGNYRNLIQGYRDGRQFDRANKLRYADSALNASMKYGTPDNISRDYLSKGVIYYYYQKNYRKALGNYVQAYKYSKHSKDQYLKYKILYHMGLVKSHLAMYNEALGHFNECLQYYSHNMPGGRESSETYNYQRAYYNTLHQMAVIYGCKKNYMISDSLTSLGCSLTYNNKDFALEHSYFLKCEGISNFIHDDYADAKENLEQALTVLIKQNDFTWVSVVYFYLGKIARIQGHAKSAVAYFDKVDSIFNSQQFLPTEASPSYGYLISFYRDQNDLKKQMYYTNQLLRADSLVKQDYPYLAETIHKEYDLSSLMDEKHSTEEADRKKIWARQVLALASFLLMLFFLYRYGRERKVRKQYELLQKRLINHREDRMDFQIVNKNNLSIRKRGLNERQSTEIRVKLEKFENEKLFIKKGLTEKIAADLLNTNSHYLSVYINENKGMNFNRYVAHLRIAYVTQLLHDNPKYLNYHIEALAQECGIATRQNFSALFFEINGIKPRDYIKKRKQELGISY